MGAPLQKVKIIAECDQEILVQKERAYGASWRKYGGVSAFMNTARKFDRMVEQCKVNGYDIFKTDEKDRNGIEGVMESIRDLRRYLFLIEIYLRHETMEKSESINQIHSSCSKCNIGVCKEHTKVN